MDSKKEILSHAINYVRHHSVDGIEELHDFHLVIDEQGYTAFFTSSPDGVTLEKCFSFDMKGYEYLDDLITDIEYEYNKQ